jgi:hypothetical protein
MFNKINKKLYMPIKNNKFIDSVQRLSQKYEINMLFLKKKVEYLFQFKIKFLKFKLIEYMKINFILSNQANDKIYF